MERRRRLSTGDCHHRPTHRWIAEVASGVTPVIAATQAYERWLHKRIVVVVESDLKLKHQYMKDSLFAFLRGPSIAGRRYGRIPVQTWPRRLACSRSAISTWKTSAPGGIPRAGLIWGVNDFDEVARMPYAIDLVRLVTSAMFAKRENGLSIDDSAAAAAVLEGLFRERLLPAASHSCSKRATRTCARWPLGAERDPVKFWESSSALRAPSRPSASSG